jgi:GGDEF domain-containing protein
VRDRLRYALFVCAAVFGVGVFAAFVFFERPGLGIAHFLYVAIILAAVAGGPWIGASAATIATAMYATGVLVNPDIPSSEVVTMSTAIRFVTYVSVGVVTGYFANRNQALMKELELLAERDALTGTPNTRAFERAITERLGRQEPFALLIGGVDSFEEHMRRGKLHADDTLRHVANRLQHALLPGDEVARVGSDQFAILTYSRSDRRRTDLGEAPRSPRHGRPLGHVRLGLVPAGWIERSLALPSRRRAPLCQARHPPPTDRSRGQRRSRIILRTS